MRFCLPAALLCGGVLGAADGSLAEFIAAHELAQRSVLEQTETARLRAAALADQLRCNRLGDAGQAEQLASGLAALVRAAQPDAPSMHQVLDGLARARLGATSELPAIAVAQGELAERLDRLARAADGTLVGADGRDDLRAAIASQRRLYQETGTVAEQTLGSERSALSAAEQASLARLARQQQLVGQTVQDAARALGDAALAGAIADAEQAATALGENRLAEAQQAQERVLDRLEASARSAAGAPRDPGEQRAQLAETQRAQQQLLAQTQAQGALSKTESDRLAARQRDVARAMQAQQHSAAQQAAEQAMQSLQRLDKPGAEQAMARALQAMAVALEQLPTAAASADVVQPSVQRGDGWRPLLQPQDRETLSQSAAEGFPARYEQALIGYFRALADGGAP